MSKEKKLPKTIIFLIARDIYPIQAGPIKLAFNQAYHLKKMGFKTILIKTWFENNSKQKIEKKLSEAFDEIHIININKNLILNSTLLSITKRIFDGIPLQASLISLEPIIKDTKRVISKITNTHKSKNQFFILFFTIRSFPMWKIAEELQIPHSINLVDSICLNLKEKIKHQNFIKKLFWKFELKAATNFEKNLPSNPFLNSYISVSEEDLKEFKINSFSNELNGTKLIKSTIGISNNIVKVKTSKNGIIFFGSLFYEPNITAVNWLIDEIMPKVWDTNPNIKLLVAGREPSKKLLKKISKSKKITLIPNPSDMNILIKSSKISVAPMLTGSGQQFKIIDSLINGIPVVTTSKGSIPLGLKDGKHLLVADSSKLFAQSIIRLFNDKSLADNLALNGRNHAIYNFTWKNITKKLVDDLFS